MKEKKAHIATLDYISVALSFLIFMLAWLNGNLTDMPWYGLLLVVALSIAAIVTIFSVLDLRRHRQIAIAFSIILLLFSIPSMMHRLVGFLSTPEAIMFYAKQVYLPLLAGTTLFLLMKKRKPLPQVLLRWGPRIYAVLGIMLGILILHAELTRSITSEIARAAELSAGEATTFTIVTGVGIALAVTGLIINPLYVVWRNAKEGR